MIKHIKSLPHHPKRVIVISLIIAAIVGTFGYISVKKNSASLAGINVSNTDTSETIPASGNLTLGFLASGRIKTVSVKAGDMVRKGQILATLDAGNTVGALTQAKASYETAQANYNKIISGATGSTIDVAKAAVNTAQVNLDGTTKQQTLLVANAYTNLLNSTIVAKSNTDKSTCVIPTVSGTYNKNAEGSIVLTVSPGGNADYFNISGISSGTGIVSSTTPEPISDTGLYIEFPSPSSCENMTLNIDIPNTTAPNYLSNYNAYQAALQTQNQMISNAQATLDQANAALASLVSAARPEDVAAAQAMMSNAAGAVQIAEAAYENTIITAPSDGTVVSVSITPGQIAVANAPAIQFTSVTSVAH